jgi:hypothetical protein
MLSAHTWKSSTFSLVCPSDGDKRPEDAVARHHGHAGFLPCDAHALPWMQHVKLDRLLHEMREPSKNTRFHSMLSPGTDAHRAGEGLLGVTHLVAISSCAIVLLDVLARNSLMRRYHTITTLIASVTSLRAVTSPSRLYSSHGINEPTTSTVR